LQFHPTETALQRLAEGFLVSSASTAVIAAMLGTMLLFRFQGRENASHKELAIAWSPLIILDWSILTFLVGIVAWYVDKSNGWRGSLIAASTAFCLAFCTWMAVDMWFAIKQPGGLGREETLGMAGNAVIEGKLGSASVEKVNNKADPAAK
jgi:ABC-type xylose transport system permease subunit